MLVSQAAANNAAWCDLVCRTHGLATSFDEQAWTSRARTPPYYPDAVTLSPDVSTTDLLKRIDASPGCSIKDSFAVLDLTPFGFEVLFEAQWIRRGPAGRPRTGPTWEVVETQQRFVAWERAWRGDDGPTDVLRPSLLHHDEVTLLAAGDLVVAGAILYQSAEVVGISNLFSSTFTPAESWAGGLALVDHLFPDSTLVGYETGADLRAAHAAGFETVAPLRVWIHSE
ncbi:MAG: hypothetical protein ABIP36_00160 [Acidimicrobiales bacterium]